MPGDEEIKKPDEDKKSDDGKKEGDEEKTEEVKVDENKLSTSQQKLVDDLVDRCNEFSTHVETTVNKIDEDIHSGDSQSDKQKLETIRKEIEPYLVRDDEKMGVEVKVEVENALLTIMGLKYKAEQEVIELKELLRNRNYKIYELEKENKEMREHNLELENVMKGGNGRAKQSTQQNINMAMQSQNDIDGFDRIDEDQPTYDQPPSQDDDDDFWHEGKAGRGGHGNDNDLWIMGNKDNLPSSNINSYNAPGIPGQNPGFKSIPKRAQGYNANDDMAFYGVGAKKI
jgi:hypothetical protein